MNIQDKFNKVNHIYKITANIDLQGNTLNIPANCTLDFQGGKLTNGSVTFNKTKVLPSGCVITDYITATISGTFAKGQCLFDGSIGKPKWWDGTKWIDATGADV